MGVAVIEIVLNSFHNTKLQINCFFLLMVGFGVIFHDL